MQNYWWYQSDWHSQMDKRMQVAGLGARSRLAYSRAMRMLVEHYDKTPDLISEEELINYFIPRQDVSGWSPATMRIAYSGIKFFFLNVLRRDWHTLDIVKAKREKRLPAEVRPFHNYAFLVTVYTCGLRLQEALFLEVSDIDGHRKMIHVHRGKGVKHRYVPLPDATYHLLQDYWRTHRNPRLLFPAVGRGGNSAPTAESPMSIDGVQGAFRRAKFAAGVRKKGVSIHTLRHFYATHLLEAGAT